jgi:hypothetical protein
MSKINFAFINKWLIFVFILFLPTQVGKHFFPPFSYISGVRIDYLDPTLYLIDIIAAALIILNFRVFFELIKNLKFRLFIGVCLLTVLFASIQPIAVYKTIKFVEIIAIFYILKKQFENKKPVISFDFILTALLSGACVELFLSSLQVIFKHSMQGVFYFLGERYFSLSMPDIAKGSLNGVQILRAYGTFSHPNSLAGFYLALYVFVLTFKPFEKYAPLKYTTMFVSAILIFLSFSKIPILIFLLLNFWYVVRNPDKIPCLFCKVSRIFVILVLSIIFLAAKGDQYTLVKRTDLLGHSLSIINNTIPFGVGLGNYLVAESHYPVNPKYAYFFLQPVHNIFLLYIAEAGLILSVVTVYFLYEFVRKNIKIQPFQYVLVVVVLTGLFDHYWLTLQQNFLLLPVLFSLTLNNDKAKI